MKKRLFYVGALLTLSLVNAQQPQDSTDVEALKEIIVTATKVPIEKKNLGKLVYQITPETIRKNQGKTLVDLLNDAPGVEINGNYSTRGQNLGYYLRGGRNRQVAILIDGMNINDPSSFNGDFDLRLVPIDQVEKIEILKGAASTLYGTAAATGVINIILKKAGKIPFQGSFSTSIGTNSSQENQELNLHSLNTSVTLNGTTGKVNYLIGLHGTQSKGLSAAESTDENSPFQGDPFNRVNSLVKLGYAINDNLKLGVFTSYDEFDTDFDEFDFVSNGYVDADNSSKSIQKRVGFTPSYTYAKGELKLNAFYTEIDRTVAPSSDVFEGEAYGFDLYNNYKFSNTLSVLAGIAMQYQDMFQKTSFSSIEEGSAEQHFYDPYLSINFTGGSGFNLNAGGRLNIHDEYGTHLVYNVNPSYTFDIAKSSNLKVFGSYSTAFVTPTLQEIFNKLPTIEELNPEEVFTVEGGFDYKVSDKFSINGVYYYREETNKIGFDFTTFQTINDLGTFVARGIEAEALFTPSEDLQITTSYGYINRDESLLLKIPKHKVNVNIGYEFSRATFVSLNGKFVDATDDFGGITLPSYRVIDLFANHKLIDKRLTLFTAVTNLFNEDFQEIAGFSTRGRNYELGLRLNF
ncbi:MAG: TonB-dependent receptor [Flavobacteriaceae bacterium]|nr:TonB-dependent receptor [Flavobacteriaceae bacterium]